MKKIFGFWSLINTRSLKFTVPDANIIWPSYIEGFIRKFNHYDAVWFRTWEYKGIPMCSLNVQKYEGLKQVNGLVFEVSDEYMENLLEREQWYDLIETEAFCYMTKKSLWKVYVFSAKEQDITYNFLNEANNYYLYLCLEWAKEFGTEFIQDFINSTYIRDKSLWEVDEIADILIWKKTYDLSYVG